MTNLETEYASLRRSRVQAREAIKESHMISDFIDRQKFLQAAQITLASTEKRYEELQLLPKKPTTHSVKLNPTKPSQKSLAETALAKLSALPTITTEELRRRIQLEMVGVKYDGHKEFVWRPKNEQEAAQLIRLLPKAKSGRTSRGFSVERIW